MQKIILCLSLLAVLACSLAYAAIADSLKNGGSMSDKKILIAYYSYSGNTEAAAEKIKTVTGGDLFKIEPLAEYPKDYNSVVNQAKIEKAQNTKPKLKNNGSTEGYDVIFIGTPVWWYTMASPVRTFLAENDFENKVIVPFCTHGGGGASSTYSDIQKLAPDAKVLEGYTTYENTAKIDDIKKWVSGLNL